MAILRRGLVLFLGVFLAVLTAAGLASRQLTIRHFDAHIVVHPDATIEVTEIIEAHFTGVWNGLYRTIPVEYNTAQGLNYTLFLDVLGVTDDNGSPLKHEASRDGGNRKFKIWVPGATDATRTVILRYRVKDGLRFFEDHDELYWNITGNQWDVPIESATARIELPEGVTGIRTLAFTGAYGGREQDADTETQGNVINFRTRRALAFHEGVTAVIGWDKGFVHEPGQIAQAAQFLESNWPVGIPIFVFVAMFWLWYTTGRDPRRQPITVQYEPPDKLSPGEAGTLVDNEAAMRDITATLVDLAVRGYMVIEQKDKAELLGILHHKEYIFHLKKPPADWKDLRPHEREILDALFEGGTRDSVKLSELQNHFYTHLPTIRDRIFESLMSDNYYLHRPDKVRQAYIAGGLFLGVALAAGAGVLANTFGMAPLPFILSGVFSGVIICGFGYFMPARTPTGARALEKVLGFEDFLGRVEEPHFERVDKTPEMFEKFLPYAMALHVEKKWVKAFDGIYREPPQWYQGYYGANFNPYFLVNDLSVMSNQAGTVMASSPRSSSGGSGFGGGGFSGGGFGGGGGGGF